MYSTVDDSYYQQRQLLVWCTRLVLYVVFIINASHRCDALHCNWQLLSTQVIAGMYTSVGDIYYQRELLVWCIPVWKTVKIYYQRHLLVWCTPL